LIIYLYIEKILFLLSPVDYRDIGEANKLTYYNVGGYIQPTPLRESEQEFLPTKKEKKTIHFSRWI